MAKIYVFDDEYPILYMIKKMLEKAGHEVEIATNGREGMRLIEDEVPDMIITDIIMPEKEGLETIVELRKLHPELKIIAISGGGRVDSVGYLPSAKLLGADVIIYKPFVQADFIEAVNNLLNGIVSE
ncbi:MAG: response regulator [Bacteroidales bacterium]|nr:response regulator [Bacteroidales bacterium]